MKNLSIALCDDDALFRSSLRCLIEECFQSHGEDSTFAEYGCADELISQMTQHSYDLIFLDIDMPRVDGILLGHHLRSHGCQTDIIYVSNLDERVYEIFSVHPFSFVRKSRCAQELPAVIGEYLQSMEGRRQHLTLPGADGALRAFPPEDIVYVEAAGKLQKLSLFSKKEPALVKSSLLDLEQQMLPLGFIRIHKGFLVNYRYIQKITSRSVLLDTGLSLPVGRDRLKSARESYLSLMKWKGLGPGE